MTKQTFFHHLCTLMSTSVIDVIWFVGYVYLISTFVFLPFSLVRKVRIVRSRAFAACSLRNCFIFSGRCFLRLRCMGEKLFDEFWSSYLSQLSFNTLSFLWFVPKEELSLGKFFIWCFGTVNWFQRVRIVSCVPCFCADSHGSRGEILHLFKLKV